MGPLAKRKAELNDEDEEELTDDEVYTKRHEEYEKEEIKKYNIGLDKKD